MVGRRAWISVSLRIDTGLCCKDEWTGVSPPSGMSCWLLPLVSTIRTLESHSPLPWRLLFHRPLSHSTSRTAVWKHFRTPHYLRLIYLSLPSTLLGYNPQRWQSTHLHSYLLSRLQIRESTKGRRLSRSPQCMHHAHLNPRTLAWAGQNINSSQSDFSTSAPLSSSNPPWLKKMDFPLPFHPPSSWRH